VINCNKRGKVRLKGALSEDDKMLEEFCRMEPDRILLREQIELYNPHVIVCCGGVTEDCLCAAFDTGKSSTEKYKPHWKCYEASDGNTLSYYWRADTLVIRFYHPNAHMESAKLYSLLSGCVKQALDNQLK